MRSLAAAVAIAAGQVGAQTMQMQSSSLLVRVAPGQQLVVAEESTGLIVRGVMREGGAGTIDLAEGDRVVRAMDRAVSTRDGLLQAISAVPVGSVVRLGVVRGNASEREVTFTRQAPPAAGAPGGSQPVPGGWTSASGAGAGEFSIGGAVVEEDQEGLPVVKYRKAHAASATIPLRAGDLIVELEGRRMVALAGLVKAYGEVPEGRRVTLVVRRAGETLTLAFVKPAS